MDILKLFPKSIISLEMYMRSNVSVCSKQVASSYTELAEIISRAKDAGRPLACST